MSDDTCKMEAKNEQLQASQKCFIIWTVWRRGQHGEIDQSRVQHFPKGTLVLVMQSQKSVFLLSEAAVIQKKGRNWNVSFSGS